jgi:sulfate adenylyltransferase subunit 2
MTHLEVLENKSVHILREAYNRFGNLCMLWSVGKDSTVLLHLARKAFFGHVPFPLVHIDTHYKIPEMIAYRDALAREWRLDMVYGENARALEEKQTFPDGNTNRIECCKNLKTEALRNTLSGAWVRYRMDHTTGTYQPDTNTEPYTGVIVGVRADEEGSRSKERYFSRAMLTTIGISGTSRRSFGGNTKPIFAPVPTFVFIRCSIGRSWTFGSTYTKKTSPWCPCILIKATANAIARWVAGRARIPWSPTHAIRKTLLRNSKTANLPT